MITLNKEEFIIAEDRSAKLFFDKKWIDIFLIITTKKVKVYFDTNKEIDIYEFFRIAKGVSYPPNYELIFEEQIEKIKNIKQQKDIYFCEITKDKILKIKTTINIIDLKEEVSKNE